MTSIDTAARGEAALDAGRWAEARACFEASIGDGDTASARLGLARALWWMGENQASVDQSTVAIGRPARCRDGFVRLVVRRSVVGSYRAPSVDAAVTTEVESTPLVERISATTYRQLRDEAVDVLQPFTRPDGSLVAPFECLVVAATRN